jgi:hypothetical protein
MRKTRSWRVCADDATYQNVEDLARRQSRPAANMCLYLIKLGIEQIRAQQRPVSEPRSDDRS